jgi:hypothetical protein
VTQARSFSSVESAASTAATERGLPAASGMTVPGKSVVCCKGSTAISKRSPLPAVSSAISATICGDSGSTGRAASSAPCGSVLCVSAAGAGCGWGASSRGVFSFVVFSAIGNASSLDMKKGVAETSF